MKDQGLERAVEYVGQGVCCVIFLGSATSSEGVGDAVEDFETQSLVFGPFEEQDSRAFERRRARLKVDEDSFEPWYPISPNTLVFDIWRSCIVSRSRYGLLAGISNIFGRLIHVGC